MVDALTELQAWYESHCDGEWEHQRGIEIQTLDNPGWRVRVNLAETELEHHPFEECKEEYDHATNWLRCWVEDGAFHGTCGPQRLTRVVEVFVAWAKGGQPGSVRRAV